MPLLAAAANAQVSNNTSLNGKYFFRQVALLTGTTASGPASISQTESAWGTLTFDGIGGFTVSGSQLTGTPLPPRFPDREPTRSTPADS